MNPFKYESETIKRPVVIWLMRAALFIGCLYTGLHNFNLYHRGLGNLVNHDWRNFVAAGIAFVLEASFYFSVEGRGRLFVTDEQRSASAWGAFVAFLVITFNTVTDHAMNVGRVREGDWLSWWASYGAAAMIVAVVGYIGYLKANSAEAMLAAEASKAEAARVRAVQKVQTEILSDPLVIERYRERAREWATGIAGSAPKTERVNREPEQRTWTNGKDHSGNA